MARHNMESSTALSKEVKSIDDMLEVARRRRDTPALAGTSASTATRKAPDEYRTLGVIASLRATT